MTIVIREPGSAFTHLAAMAAASFASIPLLIRAALSPHPCALVSMTVFMGSMILLYAASTLYHSVNLTGRRLKPFKRFDHMMISVLIAGSYTPLCLVILPSSLGHKLLFFIWVLAFIGIFFKLFWVTCPKWISSLLYLFMGWACVTVLKPLWFLLPHTCFFWLVAGGIFYSVGGILYACRFSVFNAKHRNFGSHEIFHLFVMAGSLCHYFCMYLFL